MRLEATELGLSIVPESPQDVVYIERLLCLKNDGDYVRLVRQNVVGLSRIASITTHPFPVKPQHEAGERSKEAPDRG